MNIHFFYTVPKTNSLHLKIGRAPKGNDRIPTIHFQGLLLLVSGRVAGSSWKMHFALGPGTRAFLNGQITVLGRIRCQDFPPQKAVAWTKVQSMKWPQMTWSPLSSCLFSCGSNGSTTNYPRKLQHTPGAHPRQSPYPTMKGFPLQPVGKGLGVCSKGVLKQP